MRNRVFYLGLIAIFLLPVVPQAETKEEAKINWLTIEEAQALSKKNPKKIFVDVYTNWCKWCKVMDKQTFDNSEVANYVNENYYAVKLNAEGKKEITFKDQKTTEAQLARSMRVSSYPTVVFMNSEFTEVTPVPGFRKPDEFIKMLKQFKSASR